MTALSGLCWYGSASERDRLLGRMLSAQALYGRNGEARWGDHAITLGRTLSERLPEDRFDRSVAASADGRLSLVADVRIDNRDELADAVDLEPATLRTTCDAALLLAVLDRFGEAALSRIDGDFAFALWNAREQSLLLARDYIGQRPLHFHCGRGWFAFASMPKGLHALPDVPYAPRPAAAAEFLASLPEHGTATFFESIERVPPGHSLRVDARGHRLQRWWAPEPEMLRRADPRQYAEGLAEHVDRAVKARLRGAGKAVGTHLSGGLDSAIVAASAARQIAPGRVVAFTAVPGQDSPDLAEQFGDEWAHAAAVAAMHPNIEHVPIRTSGKSPLANLDRNFFLYERPVPNLCNGLWVDAIKSQAQQHGLGILLTGQMGNLSVSYGGLGWLAELARGGRMVKLASTVQALRRNGVRYGSMGAAALGPLLPPRLWQAALRLSGRKGRTAGNRALQTGAIETFSLEHLAAERSVAASGRPWSDTVAMRIWALQRVDRGPANKGTLGGWGIDLRDPLADRRLVEFCLSIPEGEYLRGGRPRALARSAFRDRLPAVVCDERRKGLQAADWHIGFAEARGELREELGRLSGLTAASDIIDVAGLERKLEAWPERGYSDAEVIRNYRHGMLRALSAGHFLRKASGANC